MKNYEQSLKNALNSDLTPHEVASWLKKHFPELNETKDEKMRRELISFLELCQDTHLVGNRDREKWISWLEKQKAAKTPQWMIDFLDEHRRHFGSPMDYDEHRDVDGKLLCIKEWLNGNCVAQKTDEWNPVDEQNLNAVLGFIDDEYLRRWLKDVINTKYDHKEWSEEDERERKRIVGY